MLLELLERGELDVAFTELPLPDGPLEATRLLDDPYVLIVPEEHAFALLDRPLTLEELADVPLITFKCRSQPRMLEHVRPPRPVGARRPPRRGRRHAARRSSRPASASASCRASPPTSTASRSSRSRSSRSCAPRIVAIAWHRDRLRTCTAGLFVDLAIDVAAKVDRSAIPA